MPLEERYKLLKEFANHLMQWQAMTTIPLLEKYGDSALEYLKKKAYDLAFQAAKKRYAQFPKDKRSLSDYRQEILQRLLIPTILLGSKGQMISLSDSEMVSEDLSCAFNNAWREVTSKPVLMCELYDVIDRAYANAFNPRLDYKQYGKGLAENEDRCCFIMQMDQNKKTD